MTPTMASDPVPKSGALEMLAKVDAALKEWREDFVMAAHMLAGDGDYSREQALVSIAEDRARHCREALTASEPWNGPAFVEHVTRREDAKAEVRAMAERLGL